MQRLAERPLFRQPLMSQVKPRWQLDPDLVLYLPFWNMPDGQTFLSQDAYGHTATRYGATPTGQGGWSFDGTDDYVDVSYSPAHNLTTAMTYLLGVYPTAASDARVFTRDTTWSGIWSVTNTFGAEVHVDGAWRGTTAVVVPLNSWSEIGLRYDSVTRTLDTLLNGKVSQSTTLTGLATYLITGNASSVSRIAGWIGGGYLFPARIAYVLLYNRALTEHEIYGSFLAKRGLVGM